MHPCGAAGRRAAATSCQARAPGFLRAACRCTRGIQSIASTLHRTGEAGSLRPRSSRLYAPLGLAGGLQAGMDRGCNTSSSSCCAAATCCSSRHCRHTAVRLAARWGGKCVASNKMIVSAWHLGPCRNCLCLQCTQVCLSTPLSLARHVQPADGAGGPGRRHPAL